MDGETVIVGADSNVWRVDAYSNASYMGNTIKFRQLERNGVHVLFGFYGSETVGEPIGVEIEASMGWVNWTDLVKVASDSVRRGYLSHMHQQGDQTGIFLAGYLADEPGIETINVYGSAEANENPMFVGNGRLVAKTAWKATIDANPDLSVEDRFRLVFRHTVNEVKPLGPPIRYWKVTRDGGVEDLDPDPLS